MTMRPSVYVWCPAYALSDVAQLQRTEREAAWLAESLGLMPEFSPYLRRAGPPEQWLDVQRRVEECTVALEHRIALAARGGYGCSDLAESVLAHAGERPGMLIGYSDLTVLHCCWRLRGWGETLYGFMPGVEHGERARATTCELARGGALTLSGATDPTVAVVRSGAARGWCFAACLRVLASQIGTAAMPELSGCILALEDIDERPYQIDRDLQQLFAAGALASVRGLVIGRFPVSLPDGYRGPSLADVAERWASRLAVPTVLGLPFGHDPDPITLPCSRPGELLVEADSWQLSIAERAG
jgi:muramoyltetrapeptide carboxypeptidase